LRCEIVPRIAGETTGTLSVVYGHKLRVFGSFLLDKFSCSLGHFYTIKILRDSLLNCQTRARADLFQISSD